MCAGTFAYTIYSNSIEKFLLYEQNILSFQACDMSQDKIKICDFNIFNDFQRKDLKYNTYLFKA